MARPGRKTSRRVREISRGTECRRSKQHGLQVPQGAVSQGVSSPIPYPPSEPRPSHQSKV